MTGIAPYSHQWKARTAAKPLPLGATTSRNRRQEGGFTSLVTQEGQLTQGGKKSQHLRRLLW